MKVLVLGGNNKQNGITERHRVYGKIPCGNLIKRWASNYVDQQRQRVLDGIFTLLS